MDTSLIQLDIYGSGNDIFCRHGWAPRLPSEKATAALQQSLGRMYGDQVTVRYHDADGPATVHDELLQYVREERLPLPAVYLNGQLLYAGKLDPLLIVIDVAKEREQLLEVRD